MSAIAPVDFRSVVSDPDPLLEKARAESIAKIEQWLRRTDEASVLSITSYGITNRSGRPDRAFDAVAREADLWAAVLALTPMERTACLASKSADRDSRGWFREVSRTMGRHHGREWVGWIQECEDLGAPKRPFEQLLEAAATLMADWLGAAWW